MWPSRETMETHRLVGGSTSWLLVSWIKRPLPLQLQFDIHHQERKNWDFYFLSHQPISPFFPLLFFLFCLFFFSLSYNHHNLFYITRLSLWNNRGRLITSLEWQFFAKGKKRGRTVMIKGRWPRSKVSHCDLIVVSFGPFKKRPLYFITLEWNSTYFSLCFKGHKGCWKPLVTLKFY